MADNGGITLGYFKMLDQQGIIIIWASIFLLLFALLMVVSLQVFHIDLKLVNHDAILQKTFYSAEAALLKGESQVSKRQVSDCQVARRDFNYYPQMNANWWQSKSNCSIDLNGIISYYVVEDLGIEPCILLADGNDLVEQALPAAHFYRVSARAQMPMQQTINLQSTVTVSEIMANGCDRQQFQLAAKGRQSWREVYLD